MQRSDLRYAPVEGEARVGHVAAARPAAGAFDGAERDQAAAVEVSSDVRLWLNAYVCCSHVFMFSIPILSLQVATYLS